MHRLLLIENDESFVSIFDRYFQAGGYEVTKARTVEEALAVWAKTPADLVVASVRSMVDAGPRVKGAFVRQARRRDVKIVASAPWSDRELLKDAEADWAEESFSRPCHPEKIWDIVRKHLGYVAAPQVQIDMQRFAVPAASRPRPLEWSEETLEDIIYLIYEVSGNLVKTKERLINQVEKRMRELNQVKLTEYDRILRRDRQELANLVDLVTVNETYFFRNPDQFDALRDHIIPMLTSEKRDRRFSIWSAACSVGAEPYSVAMLCKEILPDWRVKITGSDIDSSALTVARAAAFGHYMIGRTPLEFKKMMERHSYSNGDGKWHVNHDVVGMVEFKQENILEAKHTGFDLAFCRNVMIYFDQQNVRRMINVLANSLREGGILAVGDSEYLACEVKELERLRMGGSTFFRKRSAVRTAR
jgi:chemotaxis protein methyltransferase CheR